MITLTAKINLLSGDNSNLQLGSDDLSGNNISRNLSSVVGVKWQGSNPFILWASKLGDGSTFSDGVNYYIGDIQSGSSGMFREPYNIKILDKSSSITNLTIEFDSLNHRYPKSITVDRKEYIEDDAIYTISDLSPNSEHTIYINFWNAPKYPLVITGIYTSVDIEIDRRNLVSIESSIFDRSDLKLPSFGIISNTGNIEFNDLNGEIRDYAEQLLLEKGLRCEIKLNNTLVDGASETIGVFETDEWNYENDNRLVSVSLKDDLEEWQDIEVPEISYNPKNPSERSLEWLYKHLWDITTKNNHYKMLSFSKLDEKTKRALSGLIIKYPLLKSGSLWQQWTKLCQVGQSHIYKNKNGVIVCRYNGGN